MGESAGIDSVEVVSIVSQGVILRVHGETYLLAFERHLWFENAPAGQVFNVELHGDTHLYWPTLDVDLDLDAIRREDCLIEVDD